MRIVKLSGGLGNQMFQYAFSMAMRKRWGNVYISIAKIIKHKEHNGYELSRLFGIEESCFERLIRTPLLGSFLCHIFSRKKYREVSNYDFSANSKMFDKKYSSARYTGYWQSEKFFKDAESEVRKIFQFKKSMLCQSSRDLAEMISSTPNSVSLHVRRGDYISPVGVVQPLGLFEGVCTDYYYEEAQKNILERFPDARFFVFSDDKAWCLGHFDSQRYIIVDCNVGQDSWQDMFLMSECKHHITANSSFSWWGAYLSRHRDGVTITPNKWLNNINTPDVSPDYWIKINSQYERSK